MLCCFLEGLGAGGWIDGPSLCLLAGLVAVGTVCAERLVADLVVWGAGASLTPQWSQLVWFSSICSRVLSLQLWSHVAE